LLHKYKKAIGIARSKGRNKAIKVVFDYRELLTTTIKQKKIA